ncbi:calpain-B [Neurospora intermedia]|uniref:Calpain-B n=1 Tax=Neurospora intermedia TaxID=5142 RepID=A0ABR3CZK2_NEUIN
MSRSPSPNPGGRSVLAEMTVYQPHGGAWGQQHKYRTPQGKIDEFWTKFTAKVPGKPTTVLPKNEYAERLAKRNSAKEVGGGTNAQASFEEAAAICRAKVEKIVQECRRVNQKYRDPHFDLEYDLKTGRRDCLESLSNENIINFSSSDSDSDYNHLPRPRSHSRRRRRDNGDGDRDQSTQVESQIKTNKTKIDKRDGISQLSPQGRMPGSKFRPASVKRVGEIFDDPKFYIDGPTANDVRQGRDGDCWLMAALCTMSNKPGLIERICVAHDQDIGVYGFVFHRDGEWFSEIIDDKLYLTRHDYDEAMDRFHLERVLWDDRDRPDSEEIYRKTYQSNSGALYFAQCENPNETWLPLLEKAYAKAHGDYAAIEGGFTGEGIEDLTGGVTSGLYTADILDKEHFWKEELMKVNEQFLFGCSTGVWGRGYGDRKGIMEQHAYSVMKAVDLDGERLLLLKNPWGKGEWTGPWSDGSKEWTPEWLQKLGHRFGDDGAFWISYRDFLRKFQAFDRTRLFGPDWKVTSIWTTLSVPWTLEYHDTKFAFTLAKPGPVVIVLSQLDDRYFRGLEGQYRFELNFRVHRAGEDDYLVRTQHSSRMNRSINVELDLDAGEYLVLVKIDATRNEWVLPTEDVVRNNARHHREKLLRIGLSYDLAHSKAKIKESPEEKAAREAHEQRKKDKQRESLRKAIMEEKEINFYNRMKSYQRQKRRMDKNKERMKRKAEKRKAKMEKKKAKREEERKQTEETCSDPLGKQKKEGKDSGFSLDAALHPAGERMAPLTVDTAASTDAGQPTQSVSSTGATEVDVADRLPEPVLPDSLEKDIKAPHGPLTEILTPHSAPTQQQGCGLSGKDDKPSPEQPNEASAQDPIEVRPGPSMDIHKTLEDAPQHSQSPRPTCGESGRGADRTRAIENKLRAAVNLFSNLKQELELMLEKGVSNDSIKQGHGQKPHDVDNQGQPPPPSPTLRPPAEQRTLQPPMPSSPRPFPPPHPQDQRRQRPLPQLRDRSPRHPQIDPGPSPRRSQQRYGGRPPQRREVFIDDGHRIPPDPRFVDDSFSESSSSSADTDDTYSISSISDISDRELDMHIREDARRNGRLLDQGSRNQAILPPLQPQPGPPQPIQPGPIGPGPHPRIRGREPRHRHGGRGRDGHRNELVDPNAEFEKNPWNAVAVVGLRVYYRVDQDDAATIIGDKDAAGVVKGEKEKREMVKLKVSRPNPWETGSDDEKDTKKKKEEEERESKWTRGLKKNKKSKTAEEEKNKKGDGGVEAGGNVGGAGCDGELKKEEVEKVLDVDDSAKDATLEGGEREKTVAEGQV